MSGTTDCELVGRWRITDADLWDRDYLDMAAPAYLQIGNDGWAEFTFGAVNAIAELQYRGCIVFFRWSGFDEGDEISGEGSAELQDDGSIEIELSSFDGDDALANANLRHAINSWREIAEGYCCVAAVIFRDDP